jgi:hypothetical protein
MPFEALTNMSGQAFPATVVHHGEHAQLAPIKQVVGHKVHAPHLIDMTGQCLGLAQLGGCVALGTLVAQAQALFCQRRLNFDPVGKFSVGGNKIDSKSRTLHRHI